MFVGMINSPCEYGNKVVIETKTRIGAKRLMKRHGKSIEQLQRIKPIQADFMIMRNQIKEIYG